MAKIVSSTVKMAKIVSSTVKGTPHADPRLWYGPKPTSINPMQTLKDSLGFFGGVHTP